jgi:hypothetical protein
MTDDRAERGPERSYRRRDTGGGVVAVLLIGVGALVFQDTFGYGDVDSQAFPRAVSLVLMVLGAVIAIRAFWPGRHRDDSQHSASGSWPRRLLLPAVMLVTVGSMTTVGFLPAMIVMFAGLLLVANHEAWSLRKFSIQGVSGIAVVVLFYLVFRYWLKVPLP